jgi:hypothetical protein
MFIVEKEYLNIESFIKRKIFEDETFISLVTSLFHEKPNKINGSASEVETNNGHGVKNNGQGILGIASYGG